MATSLIVPEMGSAGTWTLKDPYTASINPDQVYTLIGLRQLADLIADGVDAKAKYYDVYQQDPSVYQNDLTNGACIMTLQDSMGGCAYVPNSFLLAYPSKGGVPYTVCMSAINLGAIPDSLDLTYFYSQLVDLALDTLGLTVTVKTVTVSATKMVSQETDADYESARLAKITNSTTDNAKLIAANKTIDAQAQQITALDNYIASLNPPATPTPTPTPTPSP